MAKISSYQLFVITLIFQLGTTVIFGFGGSSGRDAWISQFVSLSLGLFVILIYTLLMKLNPGLTLVQWFPAQFGRWIGIPIAFLYPLLFLYHVARMLGDIRDMVSTTILFNTPFLAVELVFILMILYCAYGGIELLGRLGEVFFPMLLVMFFLQGILLFFSGVMHLDNLQPLLNDGWEPIWKVVYPGGVMQPFAESIVLAMFWTDTKKPEKVMKITIFSTIISGLMIAIWDIECISVFGNLFSRFLYPLYTLLGMISIGNFIENLQIFGVLYFLATAFLKSATTFVASLKGIQQLTGMKDYRMLIMPAGFIALVFGLTMSKNIMEHIYFHFMKIVLPFVWVPLLLVLPIILLMVSWLRQKVFKVSK